jgi:squalene-hopene/tetraprenyl-beta-curcumene cyclase
MTRLATMIVLAAFAAAAGAQSKPAAPEAGGDSLSAEVVRGQAQRLIENGAKYLLAAQEKEGGWAEETGPGITGLVLEALAQTPQVGPRHPAVRKGVDFVLRFQRADGGIYGAEGLLKNYETSVALALLATLKPALAADDPLLKKIAAAQAFLKQDQWDESEGKSVDDPFYGGAGYGPGKRPDLSNTQMMLEALHDSGLPADDPAYKKALVFIQRCQMRGESNDQPYAKAATQGGFIYSPANGGESKAGEVEIAGHKELRCYGSMTYAGFKSLLYCGLSKDDPRVRAAFDWIRGNWTLDHNPNMPEKQSRQGVYYYYHVFARALAAWGEPTVTDTHRNRHDWRAELVAVLAKSQKSDGSWVNDADRWMEGKPALTTAYAMLALQAAYPPATVK